MPTPEPEGRFAVGDPVQKRGSDYEFPGWIAAVFRKLDADGQPTGPVRYVVQDDRRRLNIESDRSLEPR